jgi:hypothetical protein
MFPQGKIDTFNELLGHFFYDWKMTSDPQIHFNSDGYSVNKTVFFKKDDVFYLSYKMDLYEVDPSVHVLFQRFYDLYLNDPKFSLVLDEIENEWNLNELEKTVSGFRIGKVSITARDYRYYLKSAYCDVEIDKQTFQKVSKLFDLIKTV